MVDAVVRGDDIFFGLARVAFGADDGVVAAYVVRPARGVVPAVVQFLDFVDFADVLIVVVLDVFCVDELVAEGERDYSHEAAGRRASRVREGCVQGVVREQRLQPVGGAGVVNEHPVVLEGGCPVGIFHFHDGRGHCRAATVPRLHVGRHFQALPVIRNALVLFAGHAVGDDFIFPVNAVSVGGHSVVIGDVLADGVAQYPGSFVALIGFPGTALLGGFPFRTALEAGLIRHRAARSVESPVARRAYLRCIDAVFLCAGTGDYVRR